jgi:hypothetical protein
VLARRSQRTARRGGHLFPFEGRDGVLAYERFLTQPDSTQVDVLVFTRRFSDAYLLLRSCIYCIVEPYAFIVYHKRLI